LWPEGLKFTLCVSQTPFRVLQCLQRFWRTGDIQSPKTLFSML